MSDQLFAAVIGGVLALTGALLVFVFTVIYTEIREARQRARERKGLARLLLHERLNETRNRTLCTLVIHRRQQGTSKR